MDKELTIEQLEIIRREMHECINAHPKAKVTYDTQKERVNITYPLPADFWKIKKIISKSYD